MAIVNFHLSHACNITATSKQLSTINPPRFASTPTPPSWQQQTPSGSWCSLSYWWHLCYIDILRFLVKDDLVRWPWPRFVLFNVKDGNFVGVIQIPDHLERNKGHLLLSTNRIPIFSTKSQTWHHSVELLWTQGRMRKTACLSKLDLDSLSLMKISWLR